MKTFVDTGAWLAVVVRTDQYHDVGALHYEALISRRERLFTSDYVLDETVTRIRYDANHTTAVAFLDVIGEAESQVRCVYCTSITPSGEPPKPSSASITTRTFTSPIAPVLCW